MSEGTIVNIAKELSKNLEEVDEAIKEGLFHSPVLYVDETGMRNRGKTDWIFTASTPKLTHLHGNRKRGTEGMDAAEIYAQYEGCMMHDHWKSYYKYTECTHAECNAHNISNLKGIIDNFGHEWAKR